MGLADAMAKILRKNVPQHKQVILAKGTTDRELQKRKRKEEETVEKTSLEKVSSKVTKVCLYNVMSDEKIGKVGR